MSEKNHPDSEAIVPYGDHELLIRSPALVRRGLGLESVLGEPLPHQQAMLTVSIHGFIKRVPRKAFAAPGPRASGIISHVWRSDDAFSLITTANTHDRILFLTNLGKVFGVKCYEIPDVRPRPAKGTPLAILFPISEVEKIIAMIPVTEGQPDLQLLTVTHNGKIKKTPASYFNSLPNFGFIAIESQEREELVAAMSATDHDDVILVTKKGKAIRFAVSSLGSGTNTSDGVCGIRLELGDEVVSIGIFSPEAFVFLVTVNGYGKLVPMTSYSQQKRGGVGSKTFPLNDRTGDLAAGRVVSENQNLLITSSGGLVWDTPASRELSGHRIPIYSRATQGVCLWKLDPGDRVVAVNVYDWNLP